VRWPRRALALSALGAVLLAGWALARDVIWPDRHGAEVSHFEIKSRYVPRKLPVTVVVPSGESSGRRLLVFLHGRGGSEDSELRNEAMFKALADLGKRAPVVAFPYGGDHSYWHDRRDGRWFRYLTREVIRAVRRRFHTDPDRVAIGGISMGGYGALEIARRRPGTFCAVGAHSPAIWTNGSETAPGAFDDAVDFRRHDVVGTARRRPGLFVGPRVWIDAGRKDPFQPGDRAFVRALRKAKVPISAHLRWQGGHDSSYWHEHWPGYLRFYARALAGCRT
jgi:S-formylglutathione hydrolase FrmB